jgi:hypothetical protein
MQINLIQESVLKGNYYYSEHAIKRMIKRSITRFEVENAIIKGEIIEDYPDDKYSPSCLIYGYTNKKRILHVQVTYPPRVVIVTVYEPDPFEWIDNKVRR